MESTASPTALYRHFDKEGVLLYVGISLSAVNRLGQHKHQSNWFWSIRRIDVEYFPSRAAAARAERSAIKTEKPLHNAIHVEGGQIMRSKLHFRALGKRDWGEGSIDKRAGRNWRLRWRTHDGKRQTKTIAGTLKEARFELRRLIDVRPLVGRSEAGGNIPG